jgi:hypothetical protein
VRYNPFLSQIYDFSYRSIIKTSVNLQVVCTSFPSLNILDAIFPAIFKNILAIIISFFVSFKSISTSLQLLFSFEFFSAFPSISLISSTVCHIKFIFWHS